MARFRCVTSTALISSIVAIATIVVGCVTDHWKGDDSWHFGLINVCKHISCNQRDGILNFDNHEATDIVLILLIGCGGFSLMSIFCQIALLCTKNGSLNIAVWIIIFNFISAASGIAGVVYANIKEDLRFHDDLGKQWSMVVACIGVLATCFSFLISFCLCCTTDTDQLRHTSYIENQDIHFGTNQKKSSAPPVVDQSPYNPNYNDMPTTPSYNELHQQMFPQYGQQQYPMGSVSQGYMPPGYTSY